MQEITTNAAVAQAIKAAEDHLPRLRIDLAHRLALSERLDRMEAELSDSIEEQVRFLQARDFAAGARQYLESALVNLAHAPAVFAVLEGEGAVEADLAQHMRDTVADEVAYAPLQGVRPEAAVLASLGSIGHALSSAESLHEKAFRLINGR